MKSLIILVIAITTFVSTAFATETSICTGRLAHELSPGGALIFETIKLSCNQEVVDYLDSLNKISTNATSALLDVVAISHKEREQPVTVGELQKILTGDPRYVRLIKAQEFYKNELYAISNGTNAQGTACGQSSHAQPADQILRNEYSAQDVVPRKCYSQMTSHELQKPDISCLGLNSGSSEVQNLIVGGHPFAAKINSALIKAIDDPSDENVRAWVNLTDEARKKASAFMNAVMRIRMEKIPAKERKVHE